MDFLQKEPYSAKKINAKVKRLNGTTMFTILFALFLLVIGVAVGSTYSAFQSIAQSNGTMSFAVNGHQGTLNLSNTKVVSYNSTDLTLIFTLASDTGYNTPTISGITMGTSVLTKDGNNFKSGSNVIATYSSSTLTINRANVTGTLVITGSSTASTYTVTINRNDASYGTVSSSSVTSVAYGSIITISDNTLVVGGTTITATPTNASGYTTTFTGWSNIPSMVTAAVTITANFTRTANQYMISFNSQGAENYGTISTMATYGSAMPSITLPTKLGCDFDGYYTAVSGGGTKYYTSTGASANNMNLTSNTTLYAKWVVGTYTITLNNTNATTNGTSTIYEVYDTGVYLDSNKTKLMTNNANPITKPVRAYTITLNHNYSGSSNGSLTSNYVFNGYYDNSMQMIDGNGYITGNFTATKYSSAKTLSTSWSGGSITLTTPSRIGYTFGGWYGESGCTTLIGSGGESYTPTADKTLYAKWTANTYTISYGGMSGASYGASHPNSYVFSASSQTKTVNNPTKSNYNFTGWSVSWTNSTHSGSLPTFSGTTLTIPANCYGNITLTAGWTEARSSSTSVELILSGNPPNYLPQDVYITYNFDTQATDFNTANSYSRISKSNNNPDGTIGNLLSHSKLYIYASYIETNDDADFHMVVDYIDPSLSVSATYKGMLNTSGFYSLRVFEIDLTTFLNPQINITFTYGRDEWDL